VWLRCVCTEAIALAVQIFTYSNYNVVTVLHVQAAAANATAQHGVLMSTLRLAEGEVRQLIYTARGW
jgi:hypothetical protein